MEAYVGRFGGVSDERKPSISLSSDPPLGFGAGVAIECMKASISLSSDETGLR
jgi:hypothetical protein